MKFSKKNVSNSEKCYGVISVLFELTPKEV